MFQVEQIPQVCQWGIFYVNQALVLCGCGFVPFVLARRLGEAGEKSLMKWNQHGDQRSALLRQGVIKLGRGQCPRAFRPWSLRAQHEDMAPNSIGSLPNRRISYSLLSIRQLYNYSECLVKYFKSCSTDRGLWNIQPDYIKYSEICFHPLLYPNHSFTFQAITHRLFVIELSIHSEHKYFSQMVESQVIPIPWRPAWSYPVHGPSCLFR